MILAVTGGTGFVGQALLDVTGKYDIPLRALARGTPPARKGVEWIKGSLSDRKSLDQLVEGTRVVIHMAGLTTAQDISRLDDANVMGTLNLIEACKQAGVSRFIFVSSLAAREPEISAYGHSKARAEKLVAASGLDWTIIRPPGVYGPRDKDMLDMFRMASKGVLPMPADGAASVIYVRDLARLLLAVTPGGDMTSFKNFEPDDGHVGGWAHRDLARAIGAAVGRKPIVPSIGPRQFALLGRLDRKFRGDKAKLTEDRIGYLLHKDWVVSGNAQVPPSIWLPKVPTPDGLKLTARWYRKNGWL